MNDGLNLFAEALVFVHGKGAETEAGKHALICEKAGDPHTAEFWRQLQGRVQRLQLTTECANRRAA